jgi:hypothetical protein
MGIRTFCFAHTVELVDGDSPYNRRHGKGHYKGLKIPFFGAQVSSMPQPETLKKRAAFEAKAMWGIFVGYHVAPGGCTRAIA